MCAARWLLNARNITIVLIGYFGLFFHVNAQNSREGNIISISNESYLVDTQFNAQTSPRYYKCRLSPGENRADITDRGGEIVQLIGDQYAIVFFKDHETFSDLESRLSPAGTDWKCVSNRVPDYAQGFIVKCRNKHSAAQLKTYAAEQGIQVRTTPINEVLVLPAGSIPLEVLAAREEVIFISPYHPPHADGRLLDHNLNVNQVNRLFAEYPSLNGGGVNLGIMEQQLDSTDIDFRGRYFSLGLEGVNMDPHTTFMGTIAAGAGNFEENTQGPAWAARLTNLDNKETLPYETSLYQDNQLFAINHSYGTAFEAFYGIQAAAYDQSVVDEPRLMQVFSSGNRGTDTTGTGPYGTLRGYSTLTGNYKMGKNVLVVAAIDTALSVYYFGSGGPTYDGRIKPEVVAYGIEGTSNAAAMVTGIVTVMQQAGLETQGEIPDAALVKAILVNTADDVHLPGPDWRTGFGNINAYRAVQNLQAEHWGSAIVADQAVVSVPIEVPANAQQLKATLAWTDPVASVNAPVALINDVDLYLLSTNGDTLRPWVLNPYPKLDSLTQHARPGIDHLNNIEQVQLDEVPAGTYTLVMEGNDVPQGPQLVYYSYDWDTTGQFTWTSPLSMDNLPDNGSNVSYLRWESTLGAATGDLEVTWDGGNTWEPIAQEVDLSERYYQWTPEAEVGLAQVRMVVGGDAYPSETFTVTFPTSIQVAYSCEDSLRLQWPSVPGAVAYRLFELEGDYLTSMDLTDTIQDLRVADVDDPFYSVAPVFANGNVGYRNSLLNIYSTGASCYLNTLYVITEDSSGIRVFWRLGTVDGINSITVERKGEESFQSIATITDLSTDMDYLDESPLEGVNQYRLVLHFENGASLTSYPVEEIFISTQGGLVFPNPIRQGQYLSVYSQYTASGEVLMDIIDARGLVIASQTIFAGRDGMYIRNVEPGVYTVRLVLPDGQYLGRLVVY